MKARNKKIINFAAIGLISAFAITVNVLALGTFADLIQERLIGYASADADSIEESKANGENLAKKIVEEGTVLVKNEEKTLPLNKATQNKVNVFGWASSDWVTGGSGSGRVVDDKGKLTVGTDFIKALNDYGIETNKDLTKFYNDYCQVKPKRNEGTLNSYEYEYHRLIEPNINKDYSDDLLNKAIEFSDTAFVVLGRQGGESNDSPKVQYKGNSNSSRVDDETRTYLDISTEEEALLEYVGTNYKNVIVVINSTNQMNLNFLDTIDNLKACVVVGGTGMNAATGLVNVLFGEVSPSGRLTDTYAYDFKTAASYANSGLEGENFYTNGKGYYPFDGTNYGNVGNSNAKYPGLAYVDYAENIYVGYKWYETADKMGYWDNIENEYGKGYEGVVQFPFGHGLSYTDFRYEIVELSKEAGTQINKDDEFEVTVRVTNIGETKGKDVVELYYEAPYYNGGIEKSSINLLAFGKTQVLEPGTFEDVKLTFTAEDMASYDCYDSNNNGSTTFELDKGEYHIRLMKNSHEAVELHKSAANVVDSSDFVYKLDKEIIFNEDMKSGLPVDNKFTGDKARDGVSLDGDDSEANITYLTRSDFEGTFPIHQEARKLAENAAYYNLYTSKMANDFINPDSPEVIFGADKGLKVYANGEVTDLGYILGEDYDANEWEDVLNQIKLDEAKNLVLHGYCNTGEVKSIGKPKLFDIDGPAQIGSFNASNIGTGFPNATVIAQTWNQRLSYEFGLAIGQEAKNLGYDGWYGPGMNLHRSPFGGRNYEYYSEDPVLSGLMGANSVKGAKNCGVYTYLKHLAVYDQETYRDGLYTWLTEQSFRELYLKPFKDAVQIGGSTGIMTSYNRVGAVWAGGSGALLNGILREEWGFKGSVLTDYSDHHKFMSMDHAIRNGGDIWMDGFMNNGQFVCETSSNTFKNELRRATKNIIYCWLNSAYTHKNYDPTQDNITITIGKRGEPDTTWKTIIYCVDAVLFAGLAVWGYFTFKMKDKVKVEEETATQSN